MKFSDAIIQFNEWRKLKVKEYTLKGYSLYLRQFCLFLRDPEIETITINEVSQWFGLMETLQWDYKTFLPKAMALRKFFEFYRRLGHSVMDPWLIPIPRPEFKMPRILEEWEYKKLLNHIQTKRKDSRYFRNMAIVTMLWDTGARIGELTSLNEDDIDFDNMKAIIRTEKSRGMRPFREIFWSEETNNFLRAWIDRKHKLKNQHNITTNAVFITIAACFGQRIRNSGIGEVLRHYSKEIGLEKSANAHSFRHHKARDIIHSDGSAVDVSNILGHASLQSSKIYTMMEDKDLNRRAQKFLRNRGTYLKIESPTEGVPDEYRGNIQQLTQILEKGLINN